MASGRRFIVWGRLLLCLVIAIPLATSVTRCGATSVAPYPWYYQVPRASFVGIVQCEVAGLITARYRVLESWLGPPPGTILTIDRHLDHWGPYLPFALCGERYLVCANSKSGVPLSSLRWCNGGNAACGQPYWWRDGEAEMYTTLATPPLRLVDDRDSLDLGGFGVFSRLASLRGYRDSVLAWNRMDPEVRERRVLARWAKSELRIAAMYDTAFSFAALPLAARIDSLALGEMLDSLTSLASNYPRKGRSTVEQQILAPMGGPRSLALLRSPVGLAVFGDDTTKRWHPLRSLANRLEPAPNPPVVWAPPTQAIPDSQLASARTALRGQEYDGRAFDLVSAYDPQAIVEFFEHRAVPPPKGWSSATGYTLASTFGQLCGENRRTMFQRLVQNAREPIVRVAAGVYLTYEDSLEGISALRELARQSGFPGGWAATVLASRGDRGAVGRALQVFDLPRSYSEGHHYAALQARLLVLLSNSAFRSGLGPPPANGALFRTGDPDHEAAVKELKRWWKRVHGSIRLEDPWLPIFTRQKID